MQLNEVSRTSQLNEKQTALYFKTAAEYGISVYDLAEQISQTINAMPIADSVKASRWYFDANRYANELANEFNVTADLAAAVISAVSPRMPWLRNKVVARTIIESHGKFADLSADDAATAMHLGLGANVSMAIKIARNADIDSTLTGTKRRSFYNNINDPEGIDSVTVDTWMMVAYCNVTGKSKKDALAFTRANEKALNGTGVGYIMISEAVRMVAQELGMLANEIQALYWVCVSGSQNGGREDINK